MSDHVAEQARSVETSLGTTFRCVDAHRPTTPAIRCVARRFGTEGDGIVPLHGSGRVTRRGDPRSPSSPGRRTASSPRKPPTVRRPRSKRCSTTRTEALGAAVKDGVQEMSDAFDPAIAQARSIGESMRLQAQSLQESADWSTAQAKTIGELASQAEPWNSEPHPTTQQHKSAVSAISFRTRPLN